MNTNVLPPFYPFGVAVRSKATLEMLALIIPYSENTGKVSYYTVSALALLHKLMSMFCPFLYYPFWGCCQG